MRDLRPSNVYAREEVTEVMLARPLNGLAPAVFRRFGYDTVVHLEWQVGLRLERLQGLQRGEQERMGLREPRIPLAWGEASLGARQMTEEHVKRGKDVPMLGSVKTPTCE